MTDPARAGVMSTMDRALRRSNLSASSRILTSRDQPWVHMIESSPEADGKISDAVRRSALTVKFDGRDLTELDGLFHAYATAFHFPAYFGWNWAAFSELMRDLTWMPATSYLTVVSHANFLLSSEPREKETLVQLLEFIGKYWTNSFALGHEWNEGEVPFNTILVSDDPA